MPGLGRYAQRDMTSLSSILFGESHGERSLAGYSPQGHKEQGTSESTELAQAHIHISIPLQIHFPFMFFQIFQPSSLQFCSRFLLVIYFIYSGVFIYVNPQLPIPPPAPTCHLVLISLASMWMCFDVLWGRQFNRLKLSYFSILFLLPMLLVSLT